MQDQKESVERPGGDVNYNVFGKSYHNFRQEEPEIKKAILNAIGDSKKILNVGAGAGSYEPTDEKYEVTPLEPSASMREKRPKHLAQAVDGVAENIPFPDNHFDASMTTFSVHQWPQLEKGLTEMRRVTKGPVVILTCDPHKVMDFWMYDYAPNVFQTESTRYPDLNKISQVLGGSVEIVPVPIPKECHDLFNEGYYARPEFFVNNCPGSYSSCSAWSFVDDETRNIYINNIKKDLDSGEWDKKYGHYRNQSHYIGSLYLVISNPKKE
ncbi:hypothetical protein DICPUDRAFT_28273 [Dictyostelium purpureum]|uniref:Methyltransferase type 11 domain-containing protein n=1 Tax=Dictyostelium purpureum TaxID=5786 RepID=F0ZBN2_DICPU|nr:uncharacterized protein DICPUDRAFT_28273 [Dictyostelium purpureum]EGC38652.1 hypothetical protein DICPUDRAFT_28273 [Dictyostelium purpureum]|eukprot:XP_003284845.1 hypothetical protein DICPUDRAFT_28273 [Dictyostelium purpureum]